MYNDHKTASDRLGRMRKSSKDFNKAQTIVALIIVAILFALASNADYAIMTAGV